MQKKIKITDIITQVGNPVLRKKAKDVSVKEILNKKIQILLARMKEVLDKEPHGAALAAPQIGESLRVFVLSERVFSGEDDKKTEGKAAQVEHFVFINPKIIKRSRRKNILDEGCLSVRGTYGKISRHAQVTVEAYDEQGKKFTRGASGLMAEAFQHEIDHLDGILFIDKAEKTWEEKNV